MEKMKFREPEPGSFQDFLWERLGDFDYHERYKKCRSGMTCWEEYLLRLGIKRGISNWNSKGFSLFYDPAGAGWDVGCASDEIMAIPIMVPETLVIKVLTLGHLPKE